MPRSSSPSASNAARQLSKVSSCRTFNDNVTAGNVAFLVKCYQALGDERLLPAIRRGMEVFLATQQPAPQAGWSLPMQ